MRAGLEDRIERDLLGPWDGPTEELASGTSPAERYLLGRLVARRAPGSGTLRPDAGDDVSLFDREVTGAAEGPEAEDSQAGVRAGTMAASSLGLRFWVPNVVDAVAFEVSWGRYVRAPSQTQRTEQDRPRTTWHRHAVQATCIVALDKDGDLSISPVPDQDQVLLRVAVRHRDGARVVDAALVNAQVEPPREADVARLYQVKLAVTATDGAQAIFLGHNDPELGPPPSASEPERLALALLYRGQREYGRGRQCAVDAEVREVDRRAWRLSTTSFPAADVRLTVPADAGAMPGLELDMAHLGEVDGGEALAAVLRPLPEGYRRWLDTQEARASSDPEIGRYDSAAPDMIREARQLADRLDRAIDLLRDDATARDAFRFANQAMALQRVHTEVARARLGAPERSVSELLGELDVASRRSWRPFQLAFVLLCLPGLTDPSHRDAYRGVDDGQVQLLFFPTGGGKTESYLGLAAYTFAIRRLQGIVGEGANARDGTDGVAVLMRYTLRLLTAQQFQRAATLACACEHLRRRRLASGDGRWGTRPFRVGLWVGASVAPNSFEEARRQVEDRQGSSGSVGGVLQLVACPWCGARLTYADLRTDPLRRRTLVYCSDPEGDCEFSRRRSPEEGLPVLTVDEEIYRLTPALVIATVDKLAQLPWKGATATLFGLVDSRCERHGWKNPDFDGFCKSRHPASGSMPATQPESAMRLRPPDLIIQDELHLICDALGSMVGLYETVVDRLCTRRQDSLTVRPVVVASSATVRRARDQVEQVFARGLTVFPPQVIDAGETFFSRSLPPSPSAPSRRYRGILATGHRITAIEIRVVAAIMEHAQYLFDRHGGAADPYMSVVDYFTSTRELAGMRRLVDDDIADRLNSLQVHTKRRRPVVSELTSRMPSDQIGSTLADLERSFDPSMDTTAGQAQFRKDRRAETNGASRRPEARQLALDVLLATSMLQVGVDVPRLGLMVVTGQPKNTAEYIQVTSRVGRDPQRPGLIFTIYQWSRPRDLAHLESFAHYHATFGSRVEGLTTTPFSDRALDRGLSAVVVAALRHHDQASVANTAAHSIPLAGGFVEALLDEVEARAERVTHDSATAAAVRQRVKHRLESWGARRQRISSGVLGYAEGADVVGLLRPPEEGSWGRWTAARSLREVEPEVLLQVDRAEMVDLPRWTYSSEGGFP